MANPNVLEEFTAQSAAHSQDPSNKDDPNLYHGAVVPFLTGGVGFIIYLLTDYALSSVVFQLAMVEAPAVVVKENLLSASARESSKNGSSLITSGIRSTLRHLNRHAGDLSMFRGLGFFIVYLLMGGALFWTFEHLGAMLIPAKKARPYIDWTTGVAGELLMAQLTAAWVHIIISKPSNLIGFRRLPSTWKAVLRHVWVLVIALSVVGKVSSWMSSFISRKLHSNSASSPEDTSVGMFHVLFKLFTYALSTCVEPVFHVLLEVPVQTALKRVQASLLPEDDDAIVPMDRQFRGNQSSGILQQSEPVTTRQAWRSFDRATHKRLAKLYAKIFLIKWVIFAGFWGLIALEFCALEGPRTVWVSLKLLLDLPVVPQDSEGLSQRVQTFLGLFMGNHTNQTDVFNTTAAAATTTTTKHIADSAYTLSLA